MSFCIECGNEVSEIDKFCYSCGTSLIEQEAAEEEPVVDSSEVVIYKEAKKRVEAKRGFYNHLIVYMVVNVMLIIIWVFPGGGGYPWFLWPLGGWGIGLIMNFIRVFVWPSGGDKTAIEKEVEKMKRETG
ncbi:2TM domain-containing protein [Chloroflexota bacterium]